MKDRVSGVYLTTVAILALGVVGVTIYAVVFANQSRETKLDRARAICLTVFPEEKTAEAEKYWLNMLRDTAKLCPDFQTSGVSPVAIEMILVQGCLNDVGRVIHATGADPREAETHCRKCIPALLKAVCLKPTKGAP